MSACPVCHLCNGTERAQYRGFTGTCQCVARERDELRADLAAAVARAEKAELETDAARAALARTVWRERDAAIARAQAAERVVDAVLQAAAPAIEHRKRAETDGAAAIAYEAMASRALDAILATLDAARGKP